MCAHLLQNLTCLLFEEQVLTHTQLLSGNGANNIASASMCYWKTHKIVAISILWNIGEEPPLLCATLVAFYGFEYVMVPVHVEVTFFNSICQVQLLGAHPQHCDFTYASISAQD